MACADGDDRGYNMKTIFYSLGTEWSMDHELAVESKALYDTNTTLHENIEYRLQ